MELKFTNSSLLVLVLLSLFAVQVMVPVYAATVHTTNGQVEVYIWNPKNDKKELTLIADTGLTTFAFDDSSGDPTTSVNLPVGKQNIYKSILRNWGTDNWTVYSLSASQRISFYWRAAHGPKQLIICVTVDDMGTYPCLYFDVTLLPPS